MIKKQVKKLDNGLTIVCVSDNTKHFMGSTIHINYGTAIKNFVIDNKEYNYNDGIAHLLEHVLIDESIYGNIAKYFQDNYVDFNGATSKYNTYFYIRCYEGFESHLVKLMNIVNNASFTPESVEHSKGPVYEEIKGKLDGRGFKFYIENLKSLYKDPEVVTNVGEIEDVEKFNYDDLQVIYNSFYKPSNEIISVYGNFDIDKTIKLIEDTYNSFDREYLDAKVKEKSGELEVAREYFEMEDKEDYPLVSVSYKMELKDYKGRWKDNLLLYINWFLNYNFSNKSKLYRKLIEEGLTKYSINHEVQLTNRMKYLVITITVVGDKKEAIIEKIKEVMNKREMPPEVMFDISKKRKIMSFIAEEDNTARIAEGYVTNVLDYNYEHFDELGDITFATLEEMEDYINTLDLNNISVNVRKNS